MFALLEFLTVHVSFVAAVPGTHIDKITLITHLPEGYWMGRGRHTSSYEAANQDNERLLSITLDKYNR